MLRGTRGSKYSRISCREYLKNDLGVGGGQKELHTDPSTSALEWKWNSLYPLINTLLFTDPSLLAFLKSRKSSKPSTIPIAKPSDKRPLPAKVLKAMETESGKFYKFDLKIVNFLKLWRPIPHLILDVERSFNHQNDCKNVEKTLAGSNFTSQRENVAKRSRK